MDDIPVSLPDFNNRSLQRFQYADFQNKLLAADSEAYNVSTNRSCYCIACAQH